MRSNGWYEKKGVKILEGRWQDFIDSPELLGSGGFDAIYTDTFSEDYSDLRHFFEKLPDLLADGTSRFSFFNGLGATSELNITEYLRNILLMLPYRRLFLRCLYAYLRAPSGKHWTGGRLE